MSLCSEASTVAAATAMMHCCVSVSRVWWLEQEMKSVDVVKNPKSELIIGQFCWMVVIKLTKIIA